MRYDGQKRYTYNYRNHLVSVSDAATNIELVHQFHDAVGRPVLTVEDGTSTHHVLDGLHIVEDYANQVVSRQYVYEQGIDRRCQLVGDGDEWWYHTDPVRSTRLLTNSNGNAPPHARFDYDPFGVARNPISHSNPYLFAGKRFHKAIGLYDSRARQYSPALGRFLQRDPKGLRDGVNLFAYVGNNPTNFVDALGTERHPLTRDASDPEIQAAARAFRASPLSLEGAEALAFGFAWFISGDATGKDGHVLTSKEKQAGAVHLQFGFGEKTSGWLVNEHEFSAAELTSEWKQNAVATALLVLPRVLQARMMSRELAMESRAFHSWNADHKRAVEVFNKVLEDAHPLEGPGLRKGIEMMAWENWKLTDILFKRNGQSGQGLDLFFTGVGENAGMKAFLESKGETLALKTLDSVSKEVGLEVRQGSWTYIELQLEAHANGGQHAALARELAHELRLQCEGITEQTIKSFGSTSSGYLYEFDFATNANFSTDPGARRLVTSPP
jgi:RHS repeat-associated protein